jgi:DNA-binding FadR family transcriptional regulator
MAAIEGRRGISVRVPKTAELVAGHIRRRIIRGELGVGNALPSEAALMEEFDVSRPTLREAFRVLESEGLISIRRGVRGGARVQVPSREVAARYAGFVLQHSGATLADVLAARVIVEAPAARVLASRKDRAAIAKQLEEHLDTVADPEHFHEFNTLVVTLTGNETLNLLTQMLEFITRSASVRWVRDFPAERRKIAPKVYRTRVRLLELIKDGDADGAENLWRAHLTAANAVLVASHGDLEVDLLG